MSKLKNCMHQTGPVELLVPKLAMSPPRRGGEAEPGNGAAADQLPGDRGHKLNGSLQTVSKGADQKYGGAFHITLEHQHHASTLILFSQEAFPHFNIQKIKIVFKAGPL